MNKHHQGFFITGTDTGVGKTQIACALLYLLKQKNYKTIAFKPIATGCERTPQGLRNNDACLLQHYSTEKLSYAEINPIAFYEATAPSLAATMHGQEICVKPLFESCMSSVTRIGQVDTVVVEGIGGWKVPINSRETMADLAKTFAYPVIMVVSLRLGCLNHALLTVEQLKIQSIPLAGWVVNKQDLSMEYEDSYIEALKSYISAPLLGVVPFHQNINPRIVSRYLNITMFFAG